MSDKFPPMKNTLFGLGEGWCLGRACRKQDMKQKIYCGKHCWTFSFMQKKKKTLFSSPSDVHISPVLHQLHDRHQHTHSLAVNSPNNEPLYSHMDPVGHYTDFGLDNWQAKV